jgi:hypothetical protein
VGLRCSLRCRGTCKWKSPWWCVFCWMSCFETPCSDILHAIFDHSHFALAHRCIVVAGLERGRWNSVCQKNYSFVIRNICRRVSFVVTRLIFSSAVGWASPHPHACLPEPHPPLDRSVGILDGYTYRVIINYLVDRKLVYFRNGYRYKDAKR